jgi:molecular chaperone Hsp33
VVVRDLGLGDPYTGSAAIVTGEIDEDVEAYLRTSEQLDSALGCEVALDASGQVVAAGGVLVQAMPGGEPELIRAVQHKLRTSGLYASFASAAPPADPLAVARALLGDLPIQVLDERPVRFSCRCSSERAEIMLGVLETAELEEMLTREGDAEITCNFCSERYRFDAAELRRLIEARARRPQESN